MITNNSISVEASEYLLPFWHHWKIYPKQTNRHLYGIYTYKNIIDVERLRKALKILINQNYNLRSHFSYENSQLKWIINENTNVKLTIYSTRSTSEREALLHNLLSKTFNLSEGELYRFHLIKHTDNNQCTFIAIFHHIILDGTQFDLLMNELGKYYLTHLNLDNNIAHPNKDALEKYIASEKINISQAKSDFWLNQIQGYPTEIHFPFINKTIPLDKQEAHTLAFKLSAHDTKELMNFSKDKSISTFNILKIIWGTVIGSYCLQDKLIIAHPVCVRTSLFSNLKGSYMNVVPFALDLNTSLTDQIIKEKKLISYYKENRFIPTQRLIEELRVTMKNSKIENMFKVIIAQTDLRTMGPHFHMEDNCMQSILTPNIGSAILLLEYQYINKEIHYQINFLSPALDNKFIEKIGGYFKDILLNAIRSPQKKLSTLQLITESTFNSMQNKTTEQLR